MVVSLDGLVRCPFCKCVFCCDSDLTLHLKAMVVSPAPVNCGLINEKDHVWCFEHTHYKLEHTYGVV